MDKVVIVTGAGRGIGAETAKLLAKQGYAVCVNYLKNHQRADEVVEAITQSGGRAFAHQADVSDEDQVETMFGVVKARFGVVTHLVNNAGVLFQQTTLNKVDVERFRQVMEANVVSCFLCCKAFINQLDASGAIVNVSSAASRTGAPFEYVDYAASKGAMDSLTKGLSLELAERDIRVNGVRPGCIYTEMHADGGEPGRVDRLASQIPLGRGGTALEVAQSIAWLLSDEASFVTGSFIDIAGGK
ncbi:MULTISPECIES: SDR family oxidoreductase [Vibrio]|uniref:SDR family oxidoreductase n=1 Tax=Vibrio neptunius TaxID=170651 RepID=A0ABS2ZZN6_9VIBR|nr:MULTISPECIES: SDR family oxidoreductase [Vibrio]MBN3492920.1 SDR family oxidoreductase [Vibrio neptunius]MBN3515362.1 SDR family oxidoreductase [Vibrio neptunius]MBN3549452.1 SDR family oxidoreductase [Vibrio neptunius]MBN3577721.1 SDR family oxidoreductase [Vibrio neptunius]MCH9871385.1 SDR family oxidoreductase [Vibrio neptunius]